MMVWLAAPKNTLLLPIIVESGETLTHDNYIEIVLSHALVDDQRLLADNFSLLTRQRNPTQA